MNSKIPLFSYRVLLLAWACLCLGLGGCSALDDASHKIAGLVTPYKPEVVQGNFISREQFALVKTGMTRQEVQSLLGTPLVSSVFHANRWDYVFTLPVKNAQTQPDTKPNSSGLPKATNPLQAQRLSLFFSGDTLEKIQGGEGLLSEAQFVTKIDGQLKLKPVSSQANAPASQPKTAAMAEDPPITPFADVPVSNTTVTPPARRRVYPPLEAP